MEKQITIESIYDKGYIRFMVKVLETPPDKIMVSGIKRQTERITTNDNLITAMEDCKLSSAEIKIIEEGFLLWKKITKYIATINRNIH